jgi:hypothetical protein
MACRIIEECRKDRSEFNVEELFQTRLAALGTGDKYTLAGAPPVAEVAILPGSNQLQTHVSKEILARVMWDNPAVMIKPHPLTNEDDFRGLQRAFSTRRVLHPKVSGWSVMNSANVIYCTSSTELDSYAVLSGKPVRNISNIFYERTGSYYPIFRLIVDMPVKTARKNLLSILSSSSSGILFPEDPLWSQKLDAFFNRAMKLRKKFQPRIWNSFERPPKAPVAQPVVKSAVVPQHDRKNAQTP